MKKTLFTLLCLLPASVLAQYPMGLSAEDMQKMQEAAACMEKIDQSELDALANEAKQFESEMKALCADGKRSEAQKTAMVYMKQIVNSSAVQEAKRCGEMMQGTMKKMMRNMPMITEDKDYSNRHVCDTL